MGSWGDLLILQVIHWLHFHLDQPCPCFSPSSFEKVTNLAGVIILLLSRHMCLWWSVQMSPHQKKKKKSSDATCCFYSRSVCISAPPPHIKHFLNHQTQETETLQEVVSSILSLGGKTSTTHATWESIFRRRKKIKALRKAGSCRTIKEAIRTAATGIKHDFISTYTQYHQLLVFCK